MDKVTCMRAFCEVVKEGGFSAAGRKLNVSKVLVSRYVAALEAELGVRLLQRTTRKMSTTDLGQAYFERCLAILDDFEELEESIKDSHRDAAGTLRLSVPSESFTHQHLTEFLCQFAKRYPQIKLDVLLVDRFVDIVGEGFDVAIRGGKLNDSSLIARKLAPLEMLICATPAYLDQSTLINEPEDLAGHSLIVDSNYRHGQNWQFSRGEQSKLYKAQSRIRVNSAKITAEFIKQDLGIGLCPSFMVAEELANGKLVRVLPEWEIMKGGIYAIYSHRKHLSARVNLLVNELVEYFETASI